jgi:hypothetical protein
VCQLEAVHEGLIRLLNEISITGLPTEAVALVFGGLLGILAWMMPPSGYCFDLVLLLGRFIQEGGLNVNAFLGNPRLADPDVKLVMDLVLAILSQNEFESDPEDLAQEVKKICLLRKRFTPDQTRLLTLLFIEGIPI